MEQIGNVIQYLMCLPTYIGVAMAVIGFGAGWGVPAALTIHRGSIQWLSWDLAVVATAFALVGVAGIISLGII
ncbi:hypothetical protein KAM429_39160 [Aquipseudomonas alcaligenes]|uniref:Uncharacterized protein n=1 Tax=Aquipseudomonas alcaligenes TaxID=43263 RepID=A0AA37FN23_AQUAC|nr:hypothetical protein KAM426_37540 [Pseudomonas alcaligenes]GIZ68771.1 hypothetical protein KAM428_38560 [Pseudomonas alcaligenes]GIZ73155.1 hypothetical protein KAM429_39160 [Pseudomonas alcaligenes]GIZ77528.1 hypothetical protein KAM430_39370 [Pseudomonas alcaligenes]GIZ81837.1 hypothetical protein KAM432_38850 [Pseudomonas alcaligenes]